MEIQVIREHLDIVKLQEKMNSIVFDYIDTSNNYRKAKTDLNQLYVQVTLFYKSFINRHAGEIPRKNTYWHLFIDCSAKLCYFLAMSTYYASNELQETPANVENLLETAARILPNIEQEENKELLAAILALYTEIVVDEQKTASLRENVFARKGAVQDCLQYFTQFIEGEMN